MPNNRVKMKVLLSQQDYKEQIPYIRIKPSDTKKIGKLMYEGYRNTIDYENETEADFITEIQKTFDGEYGPFLEDCSFYLEEHQEPAAATIISLFKGVPLVTYNVTHPNYLNNGYSTFLIKKSMDALILKGYKELYLVVTIGNDSAYHIYKKLGFSEVNGEWDEIIS